MRQFLENGGSILSMAGEGGEDNMKTNINYFLEDFGISVNTGKIMNYNKFYYSHWYNLILLKTMHCIFSSIHFIFNNF